MKVWLYGRRSETEQEISDDTHCPACEYAHMYCGGFDDEVEFAIAFIETEAMLYRVEMHGGPFEALYCEEAIQTEVECEIARFEQEKAEAVRRAN